MISWLLEQSLFFTSIVLVLVTFRHRLRATVGAKSFYFLWAIIPVQLILSLSISTVHIPNFVHSNVYVVNALDAMDTADKFFAEVTTLLPEVWFFGGLLCAFGMWLQHFQFKSKWKLRGVVLDDPLLDGMSSNLKNPMVNIRFMQGEGIQSPIIMGIFNATIILPVNYADIEINKRRLMIEHELVHAQRGDLLWNFIALAVLCLFWFNPFAWWAYGHFRHAQEMACDIQVLANKNNAAKLLYANALLENSLKSEQYLLSTLYYGGKQNIKERLVNIKDGFTHSWQALPTALILLSGLIVLQAIGASDYKRNSVITVTPIMRVEPIYPTMAVKNGIEGAVTLRYDIGIDGLVSNVTVINAEHGDLFADSSVKALRQWRYKAPEEKLKNQLVEFEFVNSSNYKVRKNGTIELIFIESS